MTESQTLNLKNLVNLELEKLAKNLKSNLNIAKNIALSEAWKILQIATANIIQNIENIGEELSGTDKKQIAMEFLSKFYDTTFIIIDVPLVPNIVEPIIHKYIKSFLMILVGSSIDAMVVTFREIGVFKKSQPTIERQ